jgi:glycosyltransferase involved in cell wall biosynthesis
MVNSIGRANKKLQQRGRTAPTPALASGWTAMSGDPRSVPVTCVMLSAGRGGLERSLLDDAAALLETGHPVSAVVHPDWPERPALERLGLSPASLRSLNEWDPLAVLRLRRTLRGSDPAVVLTVGRRAGNLSRRALSRLPGIGQIARAHNYSVDHLVGLDHVIATTEDLRRAVVAAGQPAPRISVIPNLLRVPADSAPRVPDPARPAVIGLMGRFVPKKGFADAIEALARLHQRGHGFEVRIGGSGPGEAELRALVAERRLEDRVRFLGWIDDRRTFFRDLDIFCLPSLHEPFGIVVLEGMAHAVAVVATDAEGPREILTHGSDGLVVPRGDPARLAGALASLIEHTEGRLGLARAGLETARRRFDLPVVAPQLSALICEVARRRAEAATGFSGAP